MNGMVDSFNVSVAAGILMHHAVCDRTSRMVQFLHNIRAGYMKTTSIVIEFKIFNLIKKNVSYGYAQQPAWKIEVNK